VAIPGSPSVTDGSPIGVSADHADGSHAVLDKFHRRLEQLRSEWNTLGGDPVWDLWLALNPDATSPVNGPSDAEAGISIPLQAGKPTSTTIFGSGPCCTFSFVALNLFFDGNNSTPGISVFGALNSPSFAARQ
jgi:hypothetical protein